MALTYLHTGSNLGDRLHNLSLANRLITDLIGNISEASRLYETEPWGILEQPVFLNQVILVETALLPHQILEKIQQIEQQIGRIRFQKWGERIIDVDILFYNDQIVQAPDLIVPHPFMQNRNFVLAPMVEIAPHFVHPVFQKSIQALYLACNDQQRAYPYFIKNEQMP